MGAKDVQIANSYGFTESGVGWVSCQSDSWLHNVSPDQIMLEIVDETSHQPLPDGEVGLVLVTHLNRHGMPLLRYAVGDRAALTHETCPHCGRTGEHLIVSQGSAHVTRTSDLTKIKGTLVNPAVAHDAVMDTPGVLEYRFTIANAVAGDPLSADALRLSVAVDPQVGSVDLELLKRRVHGAIEVTPEISIVEDPSSIYDPAVEFKARRFVDERIRE
jgi:phenylacetate-CoA ligase